MATESKANPNQKSPFDVWILIVTVGLALAFRIPGLTVFITADEARSWFGRSLIFLDSLLRGDWANTAPGGEVTFIENVSLSPAPGVTTMWTGAIGVLLEYVRRGTPGSPAEFVAAIPFDPLDPAMLLTLRLPNVLLAALAVGLTYWWGRALLGRRGALLAAVFIALDPFYLALSRVLGHDAPVTTFMWLSLLAFLHALRQRKTNNKQPTPSEKTDPTLRNTQPTTPPTPYVLRPTSYYFLLSGAFAGLAFLSKYPALFIGGFIALALLIVDLAQRRSTTAPTTDGTTKYTPDARSAQILASLKPWFIAMTIWSIAAGVVFVLFWPAMWVDPLGAVTAIINDALRASGSSHQKGSFFLGQPVADPGGFFYPLIILLRTTPVVFFGLLLSLWPLIRPQQTPSQTGANLLKQPPPAAMRRTQYILLAYILLYTLLVTYGGKKQDRYILPAFPAIAMLASFGYVHLAARIKIRLSDQVRPLRFMFRVLRSPFIFAVIILLQIIFVLPAYPYYFSFYNPLAGGGTAATNTVQVGWGEGLNEAAAYLNTLPEAETTRVVSWYSTAFEPYFRGETIYKIEDEKISRSAKPGLAADYVVFYINQTQRRLPSEGALQFFQSVSPVYTVTLQGVDYAWVYPSVGMDYVIADEVRLVGQAELLGYDLRSEAGEPVAAAYPESVVILSLYWEWKGKAADEPIGVSLLDEAGETRGWGNPIDAVAPLPYEAWQDGMVVRDDFALVIFPDTPPGEYRLAAWIDRPATGETVGVFPLEERVVIPVISRGSKQ